MYLKRLEQIRVWEGRKSWDIAFAALDALHDQKLFTFRSGGKWNLQKSSFSGLSCQAVPVHAYVQVSSMRARGKCVGTRYKEIQEPRQYRLWEKPTPWTAAWPGSGSRLQDIIGTTSGHEDIIVDERVFSWSSHKAAWDQLQIPLFKLHASDNHRSSGKCLSSSWDN